MCEVHVIEGRPTVVYWFPNVACMFYLFLSTVVSGSRDATLRVWNIDTGECQTVLQGHVAAVRWLAVYMGINCVCVCVCVCGEREGIVCGYCV